MCTVCAVGCCFVDTFNLSGYESNQCFLGAWTIWCMSLPLNWMWDLWYQKSLGATESKNGSTFDFVCLITCGDAESYNWGYPMEETKLSASWTQIWDDASQEGQVHLSRPSVALIIHQNEACHTLYLNSRYTFHYYTYRVGFSHVLCMLLFYIHPRWTYDHCYILGIIHLQSLWPELFFQCWY